MALRERADDGMVIHILRWQRKWTLRDLEARTGIPEATLARYERRQGIPSGRLRDIAGAFDLTLGEFDQLAEHLAMMEDSDKRAWFNGLVPGFPRLDVALARVG